MTTYHVTALYPSGRYVYHETMAESAAEAVDNVQGFDPLIIRVTRAVPAK